MRGTTHMAIWSRLWWRRAFQILGVEDCCCWQGKGTVCYDAGQLLPPRLLEKIWDVLQWAQLSVSGLWGSSTTRYCWSKNKNEREKEAKPSKRHKRWQNTRCGSYLEQNLIRNTCPQHHNMQKQMRYPRFYSPIIKQALAKTVSGPNPFYETHKTPSH